VVEIRELVFRYPGGDFRLEVDALDVARGEKVALIGPSGVGKTTLLNIVAGILPVERGAVRVDGEDLARRTDAWRRAFRIGRIGLVFQEFELLDYLGARDNILLPYRLNRALRFDAAARKRAEELAGELGLAHRLRHRPAALSQGERQRVAMCRALVAEPRLILADEPTGNLDPAMARAALELLLGQVRARGLTLVMVTHNHALLEAFDRVIDVGALVRGAVA
jgi:putative ABC transport system ATP-binding protein